MDNHFHILVEESEVSISKIMQGINQSYTQYFNKRHKKVGHLFQGRYKSLLCDKENYLLTLIQYIHLNPIRKGLVSKPEEYEWSSYNAYFQEPNATFIETEFILSLFHKKRTIALARYSQFIMDGIGAEVTQELSRGNYVGDTDFMEKTEKNLGIFRTEKRYPELSQITDLILNKYRISRALLASTDRSRSLSRIRAVAAYCGRAFAKASLRDLSQLLGRDISTVSIMISRITQSVKQDKNLETQIAEMESEIKRFT